MNDPIRIVLDSFVKATNSERDQRRDRIRGEITKLKAVEEEKVVVTGKVRGSEKMRDKLATILAPLGNEADELLARNAGMALRYCNSVGGIEELKRQIEGSQSLRARKKAFFRSERNKQYRAFLKDKGIVQGSVYAVEWRSLTDRKDNALLPPATSFVFVLPDCETEEENEDSDPLKIHIRLALRASDAVNEMYMDIDTELMTLVDTSNITELCDEVFSDLNIGILYSADGPGPEGASADTYSKKIREDSCRLILTHIKDSYDKINEYISTPGRSSTSSGVGEKRSRDTK